MAPPRTVLVATVSVPAHTYNATPFVTRLVAQGHRVHWYADRAFHAHIERSGATPHAPSRAVAEPEQMDRLRDVRRAFEESFVGAAPTRLADLRAVIEAEGVDVLLTDSLAYGAGLAAEATGIPWASFGDGPLHFPDRDTPPFGSGLPRITGWPWVLRNLVVGTISRRVAFGRAERRLRSVRRAAGLGGGGGSVLEANLSPYLHLHGATAGFEYPRAHLPEQVHWVGALRPAPSPQWQPPEWWDAVTAEGSRPLVLVGQGTIRGDMGELVVPAVRGLADLDVTVLVTSGRATSDDVVRALDGRVPDNVLIERFVPYDALLPHVDVFVTNGGYTGVTLALSHGVPVVQAGTTEEKADIGARIAYSGAGIRLATHRPTPQRVRDAVWRVLGDSPQRAAAARLQEEMGRLDAGELGAALLLELAATRRPVHRSSTRLDGSGEPR